MPKEAHNQNLRGSDLTTATAEKVFGWKNVHKHDGELVGKNCVPVRLGAYWLSLGTR
jgi:hypothetical protein